jgi:flagellar basal body-associated protein FliL
MTSADSARTSAHTPANEEAGTLIQSADIDLESGTAILPASRTLTSTPGDDDGTKIISEPPAIDSLDDTNSSGADLTRVGAVLGTPLYMSPEQCRGEKLDARSDIYSLGVITYQMLGGGTPFTGNYSDVMQAHRERAVPPLQAKKVSRKVKGIVMSALSKDPANRPQTAEAYASKLRAHSEGMGELLRRGIAIYAEYLPKFLFLNLLIGIPFIVLTLLKVTIQFLGLFNVIQDFWADVSVGTIEFVKIFVQMFFGAIVMGATTWIVAQILAMPLRPIDLRETFKEVKKRWKPLVYVSTVNGLLIFVGLALCFIPGILLSARNMLTGPAVMMEGLKGRAAFRRSKELVSRSFWTVLGIVVVMHIVPVFFAMLMSLSVISFAYNIADIYEKQQKKTQDAQTQTQTQTPAPVKEEGDTTENEKELALAIGPTGISIGDESPADRAKRLKRGEEKEDKSPARKTAAVVSQGIFDIIWMPIVVFVMSFVSVITALIYFKTRQAGGESMQDLLAQFEEAERPQSKWQERVRARLQHSGRTSTRHSSRSNSKP